MLLQYLSSLFGSVAWFFIFSIQATTSASPIEASWMSDVSPNPLHKRVPVAWGNPNQRECHSIFGSPSIRDCVAAAVLMAQENMRQNAMDRNRISDHSTEITEHLPRIYNSGQCAILITTMKLIKESHFSFIVGDIPVTQSDAASFDQIRSVIQQVNNYCVKAPPQGKGLGGIQRAGHTLNLAIVVFGPGLYAEYLSIRYGFNWEDIAHPGHQLVPAPGATA
ncbi:hypothetical protein MMC16_006678 [Acarospora aff. strigata]|nr:hypothetical protein [Acarospora aff. strigata]